ncbi:MAG: hypothetical protein IJR02_10205 [Bacteroidaceae bacterium]|nr:hypothetical protein [Bacteroidaceae bacterium]
MKGIVRHGVTLLLTLWGAWTLTGCSTIDDDLSDCGNDYEIVYELRLVTNIETEIQTQLTTQTELRVADALRGHLANIFTDFAHDIDLSFYDVSKDHDLLHHEEHVMNNNERSYTIYLPMREYRHLALANLKNNTWVKAEGRELSHTLNLMQEVRDTVASHETGLFTARTDMDVLADVDQTFYVKLYMANSAVALVLDPRGQDVRNVRVFTTGFATGFNVNDSTYTFAQRSPIVRTESIDTGTDLFCFCSVNFPSGRVSTRDAAEGDGACWKLNIYVKKADGTITETVLSVMEPLDAEQLKIIKAYLDEDGVAHPADATVGVSVTLNWNQGGEHDVEL